MNILKMDIEKIIPDVIEIYTEIFGTKYENIIKERINGAIYVLYKNVNGITSYYNFLKDCKKKELIIKFLKQSGEDTQAYEEKSYAEPLDKHIEENIKKYFNTNNIDTLFNFINTNQNFENIEEYKQILTNLGKNTDSYKQILVKYKSYLEQIDEYRKYIDEETERKNNISKNKQKELLQEIWGYLPDEIKEILDSKNITTLEKSKILFGNKLNIKTYVEYFSEEDNEKLNDSNIDLETKKEICFNRLKYFENMGIDIKNINENNVYEKYLEYIQKEEIAKILPSNSLVSTIRKQRIQKNEEIENDYIYKSKDFIEIISALGATQNTKNRWLLIKKEENICISPAYSENEYIPVLSYTVRNGDAGKLDFILLHEICHIIETTQNSENRLNNRI